MSRHYGLAGLKEDTLSAVAFGSGALVGAAVAKLVVNKTDELLTDTKTSKPSFPGARQVSALLPVAVGVLVQWGSNKVPAGFMRNATVGSAAGMVAFGLGKLIVTLLPASATMSDWVGSKGYLPFAGLGEMDDSVYDYSLGANSAEYGPGSVSAYMNGFGDAPTTTELAGFGAGAPVDVEALNGFGSAPVSVSTYAPLNTALMA